MDNYSALVPDSARPGATETRPAQSWPYLLGLKKGEKMKTQDWGAGVRRRDLTLGGAKSTETIGQVRPAASPQPGLAGAGGRRRGAVRLLIPSTIRRPGREVTELSGHYTGKVTPGSSSQSSWLQGNPRTQGRAPVIGPNACQSGGKAQPRPPSESRFQLVENGGLSCIVQSHDDNLVFWRHPAEGQGQGQTR